jgi:uncharacterized HAD superfamily protein
MKSIGVDCDDVLYPWDDVARLMLEARGYKGLHASTSWDYLEKQVSTQDWNDIWAPKNSRVMFTYGHAYPGSKEAMGRLTNLGRVHIVTSRPLYAEGLTRSWLDREGIAYHELHIIGPGQKKSEVGPRVDVFIDDRDKNVLDMFRVTSKTYLMRRPWNVDFKWPLVVRDLNEFVEEVRKLS